MLISLAVSTVGLALDVVLIVWYLTHGMRLPPPSSTVDHLAVTGLLLTVMGFSSFCFTLVLYATGVRYGLRQAVAPPSGPRGTS